ncbi:MAG: rhodanese-like domain-containing protein [Candidatus Nanopelagicales bacterium]
MTPEVDVAEGVRLVEAGAVLLDVREPDEWTAGHAPAAVHVPLGSLGSAPVEEWVGRRVVVICRSGNRSRTATDALVARGADALNLVGGMRAWEAHGLPVVTSTGDAGRVA